MTTPVPQHRWTPAALTLFAEACWEVGRAAWRVRHRPFARLLRDYQLQQQPEAAPPMPPPSPEQAALYHRMGWAIQAAARRLPGRPSCLPQALAAMAMAQRRHLPAGLVLGIDAVHGLRTDAHAWCQSGPLVFVGSNAMAGKKEVVRWCHR